jgi:putative acetyltransferase
MMFLVRAERSGDEAPIADVTRRAFEHHPHSDQTEHFIVERLRQQGALEISLVAEMDEMIVGHIAFSPIGMSGGADGWFGLGPVSVDTAYQRQGIGRALIEAGLAKLREQGAAGCVVMGDPDFYQKFGFLHQIQLKLPDCAPQYFLALGLSGPVPSGIVAYHAAFYGGAEQTA